MTIDQIKNELKTQRYQFLRTNEHLGNHIILLTLGGSMAYGTDRPGSDIDIRGIALNSKEDLLGINNPFDQLVDVETDTTIYAFRKIVPLLINANPNSIELLGCKPEHYIYLSPEGRELLDHASLFLSKRCINSFGGYANAQLRRLSNKAARTVSQSERERHILKTIQHASFDFGKKYLDPKDGIQLYIDQAVHPDYDTEIFMDVNLTHYPLRDYKGMWSEMSNIVKEYVTLGKRNSHAIEHNKLGKHMCHLIRLYLMCLDLLETGKIITYREKDHDLLMEIRNGTYLNENGQPKPEFFEMIDEYEKRLDYAARNTVLPEEPDYAKINEFVISIHSKICENSTP